MKKPNCICYICKKRIYKNPNSGSEKPTCSRACRRVLSRMENGKYLYCDECGKFFYKKNSRLSKLNFCCTNCHKNYRSYNINVSDVIDYHNKGMYDYEIADIYKCSRPLISKIINNNLEHVDRRIKIDDIALRLRISETNKGTRTGKDNHNFKGDSGYKGLARGLFSSISNTVLIKNNYVCKICGSTSGIKNVHHIKPFSVIIEEFLSVNVDISLEDFSTRLLEYDEFTNESNLIVVCENCHKEIHYGDNPVLNPFRWGSATTIESTPLGGSE